MTDVVRQSLAMTTPKGSLLPHAEGSNERATSQHAVDCTASADESMTAEPDSQHPDVMALRSNRRKWTSGHRGHVACRSDIASDAPE